MSDNVNNNITDSLNAPEIGISKQLFGLYDVTVTLDTHNTMTTQNDLYGALYSISLSITPDPIGDIVSASTDNNNVQLTLLYNTRYIVSTVATLCRESSDPTITELFYGELVCGCSLNFVANCRFIKLLRYICTSLILLGVGQQV